MRIADTLALLDSGDVRRIVDLLEVTILLPSAAVDVVSQHLLGDTCWVNVSLTVGVEGGLSAVGGERGVGQPPRCGVEVHRLLLEHLLSGSEGSLQLFLRLLLRLVLLELNLFMSVFVVSLLFIGHQLLNVVVALRVAVHVELHLGGLGASVSVLVRWSSPGVSRLIK